MATPFPPRSRRVTGHTWPPPLRPRPHAPRATGDEQRNPTGTAPSARDHADEHTRRFPAVRYMFEAPGLPEPWVVGSSAPTRRATSCAVGRCRRVAGDDAKSQKHGHRTVPAGRGTGILRNVPTYDYRCNDCGETFEIWQSFSEDALTECPTCEGELKKVYSKVGISFKGDGFYKNDHGSSGKGSSSSSTSSSGRPFVVEFRHLVGLLERKLLELRLLVEFQQLRRLISTQRRRSLPRDPISRSRSCAPRASSPSPLSSATVAIGAARHLLRRYRSAPSS